MLWIKARLRALFGSLYSALGGDTIELTRVAHRLLTQGRPVLDETIDRVEFLKRMTALADSPELKWLNTVIANDQSDTSFKEARNLDELNFARGAVNGLLLQEQRLNAYKVELEDLRTKEEFNKHSVI